MASRATEVCPGSYKTDLLDLFLDHIEDKAFITEEVEEECRRKAQAFDSLIIQKVIEERRITVRALRSRSVYQKLQKDLGLGSGEGETLASL